MPCPTRRRSVPIRRPEPSPYYRARSALTKEATLPTKFNPPAFSKPPSLREFLSEEEIGATLDGWYDLRAAHEKAIALSLSPVPQSRDCTCAGELPGQCDLFGPDLPCRRCGSMIQEFPCSQCGARDARNPAMPLLDEVSES